MTLSNHNKLTRLLTATLLAAITTLATMVIRVPSFGSSGYVNIGDAVILICAWIIGGGYGALAAGIGSGFADIFAGYMIYAPGTFIIKTLTCLIAFLVLKALKSSGFPVIIKYLISGIAGEATMIIGYFIYESIFLGYGLAAYMPAISNIIQAVTNLILGILLILTLRKVKFFRNLDYIKGVK